MPVTKSDDLRTMSIQQNHKSTGGRWTLDRGYYRPRWWNEEWAYVLASRRGIAGEVEVCENHDACLKRATAAKNDADRLLDL